MAVKAVATRIGDGEPRRVLESWSRFGIGKDALRMITQELRRGYECSH